MLTPIEQELAGYQKALELAREQIAELKRGRKELIGLARAVAQKYEDAADWKDARSRLATMARSALDMIGD
jgi:hypothetical protein